MKKCQLPWLHTSRITGLRVTFPDPSPEKYNNNVIKLLVSVHIVYFSAKNGGRNL